VIVTSHRLNARHASYTAPDEAPRSGMRIEGHNKAGSGCAIFYPRNTPSMIVNNIPSSTVAQMAVFQFGD
jgi:hypothetical protein